MAMRKKANRSLVILAILFVIAACCLYVFPDSWWTRMLLYTTEAGLVGALADLFAVTVLFRHPFGWKWIPHTAIIPKNRDKLIEGVANMVEQQLLSKDLLKEKVKHISLVEIGIAWIDRRPSGMLSDQGWRVVSTLLAKLDMKGISVIIDEKARSGFGKINLSPYAGKALKWVMDKGNFQVWLSQIVELAAERAADERMKPIIRELLGKEKEKFVNQGSIFSKWLKKMAVEIAESTNALNLDDATNVLFEDLQLLIDDLRNPQHELRVLLESMVYQLADNLQNREDVAAAVSEWRDEMIDKISLLPTIEALLGNMKQLLIHEPSLQLAVQEKHTVNPSDIKALINDFIASYWDWFKANEETKGWLEQYVQKFVNKMIETEHAIIGVIVRKTLEGFTEQKLVYFIESKVETDLQRIRLNGAYIGSALGAAFYLLLYGVYEPLLKLF
ncbi:uncharacterized membrane-anchored protein YjiN (DUF445 family) [Paenibacillus endophyticus]|uniref:Uncharacterized membrane-anchored protein YjiN (DUF445 family) n=1 Tax=Paenibacillus endophyticus TaxID=1294268 RepID=A0A7W5G8J3_9BACL|nr:DUF445 domain-containing protein [Paenibacillus endophyticus]MBB3150323.1 uncharacterized membrane-anchored protein YjiN (DUF445 family) [Paenibacillus endophyticus]